MIRNIRAITRYNSLSNEFYQFQKNCPQKYYKYGKYSSLSRCYLLNQKKECNQNNCKQLINELIDYHKI